MLEIDNKFIDSYRDLIYSEIRSGGIYNPDNIDEVFTSVIIRVLQTNKNYDKKKGSVSTWLVNQVRSVISNFIKRKVKSQDAMDQGFLLAEEHLDFEKIEDDLLETEENPGLAYDMIFESGLSDDQKLLCYEHYIAGLTILEISELRGVSRRQINNMLEKCHRILQHEYKI